MEKQYEIVKSATGEIVTTLFFKPSEYSSRIKQYPGCYGRKTDGSSKPKKEKQVINPSTINPLGFLDEEHFDHIFICDAWTAGNPGMGGYQVKVFEKPTNTWLTFVQKNSQSEHSNNYFELFGVLVALTHIHNQKLSNAVIYTDSKVVIKWINNGPKKIAEVDTVKEIIKRIRQYSDDDKICIRKWHTSKWGENPADFGRK